MSIYQENAYAHSIGWSIWHFEWVTKYRYKVFMDSNLQILCGIAFDECNRRYNLRIEDYDIQPDHVHLLVYLKPTMSPSRAVGLIKGYSSRLLFALEADRLRKHYWSTKNRSLWGDGKFMASVGHITLEKAKAYIENQEAHHAKTNQLNQRRNPRPLGWGASNVCLLPSNNISILSITAQPQQKHLKLLSKSVLVKKSAKNFLSWNKTQKPPCSQRRHPRRILINNDSHVQ